ncbi:MAG TPA: efflux RND transporter permease subunit [Terriglobia bacterium]|nr:efflux RND transporter permease subunit [Terriglobia bacterium]
MRRTATLGCEATGKGAWVTTPVNDRLSTKDGQGSLTPPGQRGGERDGSSYWFAREAKPIIFLIVTLAAVGAYLAFTIPIAVFPTTNFPRIIIGVDNGVMPIDQMLVTITRPLEEAVSGVLGIQDVKSVTSRGSAEIDLYFSWRVDMFQTLQRVNAAVARIQPELPSTAKIDTNRLEFSSFPILGYSLTSKTVPLTQLWQLATYVIKPRLNSLPGVGAILIQGTQAPEFDITPDPAKLLVTKLTISDILSAVDRSNLIESPGLFARNHQLYLGLITGQAHTPAQISDIFIKKDPSGNPIYVRDVASVEPATAPNYTITTGNTQPAVLINVDRQRESNTDRVATEVTAELQRIKRSLPPGVQVTNWYDQSWIVGESVKSVRDAVLIGIILASAVLVLFLRDWGSSFVAGMVIPITVLVTFIALKFMGESFNLMSLGGVAAAVGLIIDDAIVVVENVVLHREAGEDRFEAVAITLRELTVPLIGSTLTPIVVFVPLIAITGVTGVFFRALALTIGVALFTSLLLALTWTPNLCTFLLHSKRETLAQPFTGGGENLSPSRGETPEQMEIRRLMVVEEHLMGGRMGRTIQFYDRWFRRSLRRPVWLPILGVVLVVVSYLCYRHIGSDLLPEMDEGSFVLDYVTPPGSSLAESNRMVSNILKIVHSIPEVSNTSRRTGLQLGLAAVTEANTGDISVKLKTHRHRSVWTVMNEVRARVTQQEPAVDVEFTQKLQDMIGDLTSAPEPIFIELFSPNADLLDSWALKVADAIGNIQVGGRHPVVDIDNGIDSTTSGPAIVFQVNTAKAAQAGFTPQDVAEEANAMLDGVTASQPVVVNDRPYVLRIRYPQAIRSSLQAIEDTMLISPAGHTATMGSLVSFQELPGQTEILEDSEQRYVAVTARLEGLDLGHGIAAVNKALAGLHLPSSIRVEYGGLYQTQQESFHDLTLVLALAVIFVFLVLLFEFKNFAAPISVLTNALLATSGAFFALFITGTTFNLSSFMGVIMVIGIVAKNGILLLDADEKFRGAGFDAQEAIIQAGRRRLRPILMTALAAAVGMLPLALAIGAGSQMLQPLAIAVIGGLGIATILSLFVTPSIYYYLTRRHRQHTVVAVPQPALRT